MDQPHCHRALPHRGGAPLDRATTHVTRGEYARHASLQQKRLPRTFLPVVLIERRIVQFPNGQDEAALVEFDAPFEPAGVGLRADEDKERPRPRVRCAPERLSSITTPFKRSSPVSSLTLVLTSSSMFAASVIRSTRYLDIFLPRSSPLMSR